MISAKPKHQQARLKSRMLNVIVQLADDLEIVDTPAIRRNQLKQAVLATLNIVGHTQRSELTIRLVDRPESQALNHEYRDKDKPTNVLSFAPELDDMMASLMTSDLLGDLVICLPIVQEEATAQNKTFQAHLTHLVVHGTLHLYGYDHETSAEDAAEMEALEVQILHTLHIANPYQAT